MKTKEKLTFTYEEIKHVYSLGKLEGLFSIYSNPNSKKDANFDRFIESKLVYENTIETVISEM